MMSARTIDMSNVYVEPFPHWALLVFWSSAWLFCILFWWSVIKLIVH